MSAEMELLHAVERKRVQIRQRLGIVVTCREEDVVDVEKQSASGSIRHRGEEVDLRDRALRKPNIGGWIFKQHLAPKRRLYLVDMLHHPRQRRLRVGQGQQVVQVHITMRRPGEMFGETFRRVAVAQRLEPCEMVFERPDRADRQPYAMHRQRIAFAQRAELRVRRPAGAHVVLSVYFKESDRLRSSENVAKMRRLEADAGTRG